MRMNRNGNRIPTKERKEKIKEKIKIPQNVWLAMQVESLAPALKFVQMIVRQRNGNGNGKSNIPPDLVLTGLGLLTRGVVWSKPSFSSLWVALGSMALYLFVPL